MGAGVGVLVGGAITVMRGGKSGWELPCAAISATRATAIIAPTTPAASKVGFRWFVRNQASNGEGCDGLRGARGWRDWRARRGSGLTWTGGREPASDASGALSPNMAASAAANSPGVW